MKITARIMDSLHRFFDGDIWYSFKKSKVTVIAACVTVSIGVAAMQPIYEKSCTLLIEQADVALYQAKQNGRNRICSFDYSA